MSVTTSGPCTPVVRRMIPSGCVNRADPEGGVTHPWTHEDVAGPAVGGGDAGGGGGGTGEDALVDWTGDTGADGVGAEDRSPEPPLAPHADSTRRTAINGRDRRVLTRAPSGQGRIPSPAFLGSVIARGTPVPTLSRPAERPLRTPGPRPVAAPAHEQARAPAQLRTRPGWSDAVRLHGRRPQGAAHELDPVGLEHRHALADQARRLRHAREPELRQPVRRVPRRRGRGRRGLVR